jgi:cytochrome P450
MGVPHASSEESSYKGYTIPNKTIIFPNISALTRDAERYEDPDTLRPERFLGDDLDAFASAKQADFRKRDHINYGWGRRLCQGIHVAENSLYMEVARILWAFKITPRPGEPPLDLTEKLGKRSFLYLYLLIVSSNANITTS